MRTNITLLDQKFNISAATTDKSNNWGGDCYKIKVNDIQFTYTNSLSNVGKELNESDLLYAFRCFISDVQCVEDADFHEFCGEFGYDFDKESKSIYNACCRSLKSYNRLTSLDACDLLNELSEKGIE